MGGRTRYVRWQNLFYHFLHGRKLLCTFNAPKKFDAPIPTHTHTHVPYTHYYPGADITDYFNYGFSEETWKLYNDKQKRTRAEVQQLNKIAVSFVQDKPAWSEYWYLSCRTHDCSPRASRSPRLLLVALECLHCDTVCCRFRIFGNAWFIELTHVNNTTQHDER